MDSSEALPEMIQNYEEKMVLIGGDVISLYPNLEIDSMVEKVKEAILTSDMKWEDVDYLEGVRYLALNWDAEQCRMSKLRRVLPVRRGKRGSRPGMMGTGPRGPTRGDQEQWIFPEVTLLDWEKKMIVAEVVSIATKAMFTHHFYTFGGETYHQAQGGPIGLRGTCAIARMVMQMFDCKWSNKLEQMGIRVWLMIRYVDDIRVALPPIREGWRWVEGALKYTKRWEEEDMLSGVSAEKSTKELLGSTMQEVETYLKFTVESGEEFKDGWLPTLDLNLKVGEDNKLMYKFYEKDTCSSTTVMKRTAFCENAKIQIVSNDLVRRLSYTMEQMGEEERNKVVDQYGQKLLNSGYSLDQTRAILVNGIKGIESKKIRCFEEGRSFFRKSTESMGARWRKKLLSGSSWYKGSKRKNKYKRAQGRSKKDSKELASKGVEQQSVLFVEQTTNGELAKALRELMMRIGPTIGFSVKVVERAGSTLKSKFPQSGLWEGTHCGREECITCNQGAEFMAPCTRRSVVYENICGTCNSGARGKGEVKGADPEVPSIYVGETSRSIQERGMEHWNASKGSQKQKEGSHIFKHQQLHHKGAEPDFVLRMVTTHKTALSRQTSKAVRIMRRGGAGAVLNSKSEFNRCYIPRLQLVEEDVIKEMEQAEEEEIPEASRELLTQDNIWEQQKRKERSNKTRDGAGLYTGEPVKRGAGSRKQGGRPSKTRKLELIGENWGLETTPSQSRAPPPVSSLLQRRAEGGVGEMGGHQKDANCSPQLVPPKPGVDEQDGSFGDTQEQVIIGYRGEAVVTRVIQGGNTARNTNNTVPDSKQ